MANKQELMSQLQDAVGGEWTPTEPDAPVKGYTAHFPKFRSDAIVGVLNAAAEQTDSPERAVAFQLGEASARLGDNPSAPRAVVVPEKLANNSQFRSELTSDMKQTITHAVSQQLSRSAAQGMHAR